jgi:hypothetical protein
MILEPHNYQAYILRVWQGERDGLPVVFASLEDSHTRLRKVFAGLPALFAFLENAARLEAGKERPGTTQER